MSYITGRISNWQFLLLIPKRATLENVKHFGSMITNDERCTNEVKSRTAITKGAFNKEKALCNQQSGLLLLLFSIGPRWLMPRMYCSHIVLLYYP